MNLNIKKLAEIAAKGERMIIGLMSGTSLDGLDVAVCRVKGTGSETEINVSHFETAEYDIAFRELLKKICFREMVDFQELTLLHKSIALHHAKIINDLLKKWELSREDIDLIASHGQTVYHAPLHNHQRVETGNATLQLGDGDILSVHTGIITISDFRQKNIACGGEGAPLAVYGDILLYTENDIDVLLLNIGGISNFTYLPAALSGKIICSDTGPGNTLMNQWMNKNFPGKNYDHDAEVALKGTLNENLLRSMKEHQFFSQPFPKSTGPELFSLNYLQEALKHSQCENISTEDIMATLNKFTADTICQALKSVQAKNNTKLYISGGGIHNPLLLKHLQEQLPEFTFSQTESKGTNPDAKEAVLFALLANECVAGNIESFKNLSENIPAISMGKISFPS